MQKSGSDLLRESEKLRFKTFRDEEGRGSSRWAPFNEKQGRSGATFVLSENLQDDLGTTFSPWRGSAPFPKTLIEGASMMLQRGSPKKELLKSISSPLGDGGSIPAPRQRPFLSIIR